MGEGRPLRGAGTTLLAHQQGVLETDYGQVVGDHRRAGGELLALDEQMTGVEWPRSMSCATSWSRRLLVNTTRDIA